MSVTKACPLTARWENGLTKQAPSGATKRLDPCMTVSLSQPYSVGSFDAVYSAGKRHCFDVSCHGQWPLTSRPPCDYMTAIANRCNGRHLSWTSENSHSSGATSGRFECLEADLDVRSSLKLKRVVEATGACGQNAWLKIPG